MELPVGMDVPGGKNGEMLIELKKSLYGLKQASLNWFEKLKAGLRKRKYEPSQIDPCVFIGKNAIILVYVDDCIIIAKNDNIVSDIIFSLSKGNEHFEFTDEGPLKDYLGVEFTRHKDGTLELKQEFLIQRIINAMTFDCSIMNGKDNPAVKPLLHKDTDGPPRKHDWHYRSLIGMLNYLEKTSRPELAFAVHQCARFCSDPRLTHEKAVHKIIRYLIATKDKGLIFKPDLSRGIECFVDADFAGSWNAIDAENPANVLSRTGYVIMYAGCPLVWMSKLQTEIALSTTEAEYIALSQSMREVIPLIGILSEIAPVFGTVKPVPQMKCSVFEDNNSCLALAKAPRMTPRTKYISLKYHHFRSMIWEGTVEIFPIDTKEQTADIFTKPLQDGTFKYLRKKLSGW